MICEMSEYPKPGCPPKAANHGIGTGNGNLKIFVKYDQYAKETAFSLVHDATGQQLYFHPYASENAQNGGHFWWSQSGLPAGDYSLLLGDEGRDGIW